MTGRLSVLALVAVVTLTGCGNEKLQSTYSNDEITIDGSMEDWEGLTTYIDDAGVFVGVANDDDNLYLAFRSRRQHVNRRVILGGLSMQVQPGLSVKFPMGLDRSSGPPAGMRNPQERERESMLPPGSFDNVGIKEKGDSDWQIWAASDLPDIEVAGNQDRDGLCIELKIPLTDSPDGSFAIEAGPGEKVRLSLKTETPDMGDMRPPGGGMGGGRGGGMGGGRGGGMSGGMRPSGEDRMGESLKLHADILLADRPHDALTY